jgi:hypothetical protein
MRPAGRLKETMMRRSLALKQASGLVATVWLGCGAALVGLPVAAEAQVVFSTMAVNSGKGPGGDISARSLDRYAQTLALSADQKEAVSALLDGYLTEDRAADREMQSAMEAAFSSFQDSEDHGAMQKATSEARTKHAERSEALEASLFADIHQLLTPDQEEAWPRLERLRRRERGLAQGSLSGEAVDLTELLAELKVDPPAVTGLPEAVEQYEADVDRAIQARDAAVASSAPKEPQSGMFDFAAMQAAMAAAREAGAQVRDVNQTHQRRIEVLLPEDLREPFAAGFKRRCFPGVYRPSTAARSIESAFKLDDLTADQRAALDDLRAGYERELGPVNASWADAIVASEAEGKDGTVSMGGSVMRIQMGDESGPLVDARKARKEVDQRAKDKLASILTPAQQERLPKDQEPDEGAMQVGEGQFMIRSGG